MLVGIRGNTRGSRCPRLPLILLLLLPALGAPGCRADAPGGPPVRIILGAEPVPPASPVWVAEALGYFRDEGVDLNIREFDSGRTALFTMLDQGGVDIATAAQTPVVARSFDRNDYSIIAGMVQSDDDVQLMARSDRGIESPADLKGRKIGVTSGSSGHFFLGLFLAYHQIDLTDVILVDLEATLLSAALVDGRVDAIATWEPHIFKARKALGDLAFVLPSRGIYREDFYFIARKDFIRDNHEALLRFLRAVERGQQFIRARPDEARDIVRIRLGLDKDVMEDTWGRFRFGLFLDQSVVMSLEDEARWAIQNRLADATRLPDYLDLLHADALRAIKPDAVTLPGGVSTP